MISLVLLMMIVMAPLFRHVAERRLLRKWLIEDIFYLYSFDDT